jgi:hypothetical protein
LLFCTVAGCGSEGGASPDSGANDDASTTTCSDDIRTIAPQPGDYVKRRLEGSSDATLLSYGARVSRSAPPFCDYVVEFDFGAQPGSFGTGLGQPEVLYFAGSPPMGMHTWPVEDHSTFGPDKGVTSRYSRDGEGQVTTDRSGDTIVIETSELAIYTLQDVKLTYNVRLTAEVVE